MSPQDLLTFKGDCPMLSAMFTSQASCQVHRQPALQEFTTCVLTEPPAYILVGVREGDREDLVLLRVSRVTVMPGKVVRGRN